MSAPDDLAADRELVWRWQRLPKSNAWVDAWDCGNALADRLAARLDELEATRQERDAAEADRVRLRAYQDDAAGRFAAVVRQRTAAEGEASGLRVEREILRAEVARLEREVDELRREAEEGE